MITYDFYTQEYLGSSIPAADFPRLAQRSTAQLLRYKRLYRLRGTPLEEQMALCAVADALYFFERALCGDAPCQSVRVGSVAESRSVQCLPDVGERAQAQELYRCANLYLDFYRAT